MNASQQTAAPQTLALLLCYLDYASLQGSLNWGLIFQGMNATPEQGGSVQRLADGSAVIYTGKGVVEYLS